jgi:hypothetical protein
MQPASPIKRGTIFQAIHDDTYESWERDEPRKKYGIVFNALPPTENDDVHYFLTTKDTSYYLENPSLVTECLILPKGSYSCFRFDTAIQFDEFIIHSLAKLRQKGFRPLDQLTPEHIALCEAKARVARLLLPVHVKVLKL